MQTNMRPTLFYPCAYRCSYKTTQVHSHKHIHPCTYKADLSTHTHTHTCRPSHLLYPCQSQHPSNPPNTIQCIHLHGLPHGHTHQSIHLPCNSYKCNLSPVTLSEHKHMLGHLFPLILHPLWQLAAGLLQVAWVAWDGMWVLQGWKAAPGE